MDFLRQLHDLMIAGFPVPLFPTPFALLTLVLFLWSLWVAYKGEVTPAFRLWVRLNWLWLALMALTGTLLALSGAKVPSAIDLGGGVTKYGQPFDPTQEGMHLLYSGFALLSLLVLEAMLSGKIPEEVLPRRKLLWLLPVVTLFLYGCAYMAGFVASFPGSTPGV